MITFWVTRHREGPNVDVYTIHHKRGAVTICAGNCVFLESVGELPMATVLDDATEPPTVLVHECPLHNLSDWGAEGLTEFVIYHGNIVRTRDYQVVMRGPDGAENLNHKTA